MRLPYCALLILLAITPAQAEPLPPGRGRMEFQFSGAPLTLFTYKPAGYKDGPLVIVFHGVARNAEPYRDFAVPLADRVKWIMEKRVTFFRGELLVDRGLGLRTLMMAARQ